MAQIYIGTGPDTISVMERLLIGYPGMKSVGSPDRWRASSRATSSPATRFPIFPDGNASVARMLVRRLLPEVAPGKTMEDVLDARFDYTKLDRSDSNLRLRLNSTAVNARNVEGGVEVDYSTGGKAYTVRGKHCILACYNGMIPHLCPDLPRSSEGRPLLRRKGTPRDDERPAAQQGGRRRHRPSSVSVPGQLLGIRHEGAARKPGNRSRRSAEDDPIVLWMAHAPAPQNDGTQTRRDLYRAGRHRLYATPFATYEAEVKAQLTGMFGAQGFDAERDIAAITVNRWSHGYSYGYSSLYDPEWEDGQAPHELGATPIRADPHRKLRLRGLGLPPRGDRRGGARSRRDRPELRPKSPEEGTLMAACRHGLLGWAAGLLVSRGIRGLRDWGRSTRFPARCSAERRPTRRRVGSSYASRRSSRNAVRLSQHLGSERLTSALPRSQQRRLNRLEGNQ